jgi:tRNA 2-thiouridine synthesizing protein E
MRESIAELLNEDGFLKNPKQWTPVIARQIAGKEGLDDLSQMHWEIILYLREYYEKYDFVPTLKRVCRVSGSYETSCLSCFFRNDPVKAVKIAGLPEPAEEVRGYYRGACECKQHANHGSESPTARESGDTSRPES